MRRAHKPGSPATSCPLPGDGCTDFTRVAQVDGTATSYQDTTVAAAHQLQLPRPRHRQRRQHRPLLQHRPPPRPPRHRTGPGPITVGPTGRYLVDQNGAPFLITGDSPQALIGNLTESDAALFFASRRAEGFNTVWINLLCNDYTGCKATAAPGTASRRLRHPAISRRPTRRTSRTWTGFSGWPPSTDWSCCSTRPRPAVGWTRWSQWRRQGPRLRPVPRPAVQGLPEHHLDERQRLPELGTDNDPYVTAVALGIADTDTNRLQTVELNFPTSGSLDDPTWAPVIDLNASYTYDPTYVQVLNDYNRSNFLPTFLVEASYEFEQNAGAPLGTPQQLRRQEYWSLLSGATGQLYGNHYTWQFICPQRDDTGNCVGGWKDQLNTPGQQQMAYVNSLFESRPWYDLVPDQTHTVVTDGLGTYGTADYVTAARTPDGTLAIAYVPSSRTITVDLSTFSGPVTARWYDPTAGTYTSLPGSPYPNIGSQQFTTPGTNAGGDDDWCSWCRRPKGISLRSRRQPRSRGPPASPPRQKACGRTPRLRRAFRNARLLGCSAFSG